jgi:hypothetical protein
MPRFPDRRSRANNCKRSVNPKPSDRPVTAAPNARQAGARPSSPSALGRLTSLTRARVALVPAIHAARYPDDFLMSLAGARLHDGACYCTVRVPTMFGWIVQRYAKVPAVLNVTLALPAGAMFDVVQEPSFAAAL